MARPIGAPAPAVVERDRPARTGPPVGRVALVGLMFVFAAYFLLPLYWVAVSATKDNGQLFSTFGLWFAWPWRLLDNARDLFAYQDGIYLRWMLNSALYATSSAALATLAAAMAGFAFAKYAFPGKTPLFGFILGTIMVPATALVLPIFLLMQQTGLANTAWAVILPGMVNPFGLYLMRVFWDQGFPNELIEAARIDGASDARIFWSMGLPLVRGGLTTVALFSFVGAWNNFFLPLIVLSRAELFPLTLGLSVWNSVTTGRTPIYGIIILGSLVSVLPLIVAFLTLGRYWQGGLTVGATKG